MMVFREFMQAYLLGMVTGIGFAAMVVAICWSAGLPR